MQRTVLVVDDSEVIRKLIHLHASKVGYRVLQAADGKTGVQMARKHTPDVIIMDVQMPEMDGYEASRLIRKIHPTMHTPIIMLTSLSNLSNMQEGYEAGVDDYLTKPFQPNELIMRIEAVIRRADRAQAAAQTYETSNLAVFSLRGGSGCSSLATNLAVGLALLWGKPTALVDLVTPVGVCDVLLDMKNQNSVDTILKHNLKEIDNELIRGCVETHDSGLKFLAGLRNPVKAELLTENMASLIVDAITAEHDYTIIDLPHNFGAATLAVIDQADHIIMPITPDLLSLRLAAASLKVFDSLGFDEEKLHLIVNWTSATNGIATDQIETYLKRKVLITVPNIPDIWNESINLGKILIRQESSHPMVALLEDLCWKFSTITDRSNTDGEHTIMWERITQRREQYLASKKKAAQKKSGFRFGRAD